MKMKSRDSHSTLTHCLSQLAVADRTLLLTYDLDCTTYDLDCTTAVSKVRSVRDQQLIGK